MLEGNQKISLVKADSGQRGLVMISDGQAGSGQRDLVVIGSGQGKDG